MLTFWEEADVRESRLFHPGDKSEKDKNAGQGAREELLLARSGRTSRRRQLLGGALKDEKGPAMGESGGREVQAQGAASVKLWKMSKS